MAVGIAVGMEEEDSDGDACPASIAPTRASSQRSALSDSASFGGCVCNAQTGSGSELTSLEALPCLTAMQPSAVPAVVATTPVGTLATTHGHGSREAGTAPDRTLRGVSAAPSCSSTAANPKHAHTYWPAGIAQASTLTEAHFLSAGTYGSGEDGQPGRVDLGQAAPARASLGSCCVPAAPLLFASASACACELAVVEVVIVVPATFATLAGSAPDSLSGTVGLLREAVGAAAAVIIFAH